MRANKSFKADAFGAALTPTLELIMNQRTKMAITILITAAITFISTAYFTRGITAETLKLKFVEMSAFNDVRRVEDYDRLESLLAKGCDEEALEYVRIQQRAELSGLKNYFVWGESVKNTVSSRNHEVYERALKSSSLGTYTLPTCKQALTTRSSRQITAAR